MFKWLSGLDVNAVFAAILAVIAYLHNHSFRVAKETGTLKPTGPGGASGTVAMLLVMVIVAWGVAGAGCGSTQKRTYESAAAICTVSTLASLDARLSAIEQEHSTTADVTFAIELAAQEALCIHATVKAAQAIEAIAVGSGSGK